MVNGPGPQPGRVLVSAFRPAWWLPGPHLQTIWPALLHRSAPPPLQRETLELPDGDFVNLCWTNRGRGSIVCLFHGLEGGIGSHYTRGMMQALQQAGRCAVLMHFRGCGGAMNRLPRSYHSGDTGDIRFFIDTLARRYPGIPLAAVGYSLGGNALLKYLAEEADRCPLQAAVAVSVPFELAAGATRLNQGWSRLYRRHLLHGLHAKILAKLEHHRMESLTVTRDGIRTLDTFWRFDERVTAPLHGFAGADDYYSRSSSRSCLRSIRTPTLILHSRDDPFLTPAAIPDASELSERVTLELSNAGGHVGFVSGPWPWQPEYWLERRIPAYLSNHLQ